ncbi:MAG: hypothetical protein JEZ09_04670 [Salinivirgaceae bacterium]|nr:hypothetical protein [Salinivirgaceae bacterium]
MNMKNWKKYSFEFLTLFIAVISAFALNNWNDNRRDNNAENKILTEIYNGLNKDLEDLRANESGHKTGIKAIVYFRNILSNKLESTDSVMIHYFNLTRDFISIQNTSGYDALKSKGLELIEDDSLRSEIISLYEYDYSILRKLEEEHYESQFQKNYFEKINCIIADNFILDKNKTIIGINTPLKVSEKEEKILLTYLWKIQNKRDFNLNCYSAVISKTERIRNEIKKEI